MNATPIQLSNLYQYCLLAAAKVGICAAFAVAGKVQHDTGLLSFHDQETVQLSEKLERAFTCDRKLPNETPSDISGRSASNGSCADPFAYRSDDGLIAVHHENQRTDRCFHVPSERDRPVGVNKARQVCRLARCQLPWFRSEHPISSALQRAEFGRPSGRELFQTRATSPSIVGSVSVLPITDPRAEFPADNARRLGAGGNFEGLGALAANPRLFRMSLSGVVTFF